MTSMSTTLPGLTHFPKSKAWMTTAVLSGRHFIRVVCLGAGAQKHAFQAGQTHAAPLHPHPRNGTLSDSALLSPQLGKHLCFLGRLWLLGCALHLFI